MHKGSQVSTCGRKINRLRTYKGQGVRLRAGGIGQQKTVERAAALGERTVTGH